MNSTKKSKKQVTQQLLEFPEPDGDQYVARVVGPAGNNLHRVTRENGEESLCSMPNKFRKNIWIKRGDYVLVDPIVEGNKVTSEISRILLKEHIRHLKLRELWPSAFTDTDDGDELDSSNDTVTGGDGTNAGTSAPVEETAVATSGVAHLCIDSRSTDAVATDEFGNAEYGMTWCSQSGSRAHQLFGCLLGFVCLRAACVGVDVLRSGILRIALWWDCWVNR
eukprot:m.151279 g.151279  ORF g.151279 m.151279 type:complete len:222 (-) comp17855_c1_seq10:23-688(-)